MIQDILTIVRKEAKELFSQRVRFRGGLIGMLIFIGVFGIFLPLQSGRAWVESPVNVIYWAWIPFLMVSSVVADTFAGERERHTLETLLASRLSDRAILFGKLTSAILYGWGLTMICMLLGLVTINLAHGRGELLLYPTWIFLGITVLSWLISGLAAGVGIFISLRAATVRQAQQTFSIVFYLFFIPIFLLPLLPEDWKLWMITFVSGLDVKRMVFYVILFLLLVDAILISAAIQRFKRNRLILD